jgi:uncharacterized phage protein gp47/JayE
MPWTTPTLSQVRQMTRDNITAAMSTAVIIGNSVMRVMGDAMSALASLTLEYIDWLSRMLLPDTAETEWLDRHAEIWLVNADGSIGRKLATFAKGTALATGANESVIAAGVQLQSMTGVIFEVTTQTTVGTSATPFPVKATTAGVIGNLDPATDSLQFLNTPPGVDSTAAVQNIDGGTDQETDDALRARILLRIQEPPMGGDATDYLQWTLAVPGVTRAWVYPQEMGIGTNTVRFMCDELRADTNDGFPLQVDVDTVATYLDSARPVTVKDLFVVAPLRFPIDFEILNLDEDNAATRANIEQSVRGMLYEKGAPGQEIYFSWIDEAISAAVGETHHDLIFENTPMPSNGYMPILGTISYG